jgi:hypothetical protein
VISAWPHVHGRSTKPPNARRSARRNQLTHRSRVVTSPAAARPRAAARVRQP